MKKALLYPIMIESYSPSKKQFIWVQGYKVVSPEGEELQPYMRKVSTHYESSASVFCKEKGWSYKIVRNK